MDKGFLDWLAGFAAGDGSFGLRLNGTSWQGRFAICLREDDAEILYEIQSRLDMGRIYHVKRRGSSREQVTLEVNRAADLMRLVDIFEAHPLRAKKQQDFAIWKQAVTEIYNGKGKGHPGGRGCKDPVATYDRERLAHLAQELIRSRKYG